MPYVTNICKYKIIDVENVKLAIHLLKVRTIKHLSSLLFTDMSVKGVSKRKLLNRGSSEPEVIYEFPQNGGIAGRLFCSQVRAFNLTLLSEFPF